MAAPLIIKLFSGAHQAEIALLNQVDERHTRAGITAGNRDYQAQI